MSSKSPNSSQDHALSIDDLGLLKSALDRSISPFLIYGKANNLIYANQAAWDSWPELLSGVQSGLSRLEAVRKQIQVIAPGLPEDLLEAEVQRTMEMFNKKEPTDLAAINNRWFRTTHHRLGGAIVGMAIDITEHRTLEAKLKKARREAEQASKAKSEFLANMSHEIRTPMNGILGMADILKGHNLSEETGELVKIIERSGQALLSVINDVLDFSKLEAEQMVIDPAPFSLRDGIDDIVLLLSESAQRSNIDLELDYAPDCPTHFEGDAGRIRQILLNMIGNAIKFTDKGQVSIKVGGQKSDEGFALKIDIKDTGVGIAEDVMPHIFEKFRQADNSKTRRHGGTGLGLSISKDLAHLMGGDISVKSKLGEGSVFTFTLTLHEIKMETPNVTALSQTSKIKGNFLIIDEADTLSVHVQSITAEETCKIVKADSVKKGLVILQRAKQKNIPLNAVLISEDMPDYSAHDFVNYVRRNMKLEEPPILIVTHDEVSVKARTSQDLPANAYLNQSDLKTKLEDTLLSLLSTTKKEPEKTAPPKKEDVAEIKLIPPSPPDPKPEVKTPTEKSSSDDSFEILIAEDNDVNQMFMKYIMQELGLSYKIAENGTRAVEYWQASKPKLILMDISMPEMNGYEATEAIRAIEKANNLPRTPIIAVTAHAMKGDRERCLEADMDDYITKPVSKTLLFEKLNQWSKAENALGAKSA